jgi:adenylate kinase
MGSAKIVFLGAPGSGKGTQAQILATKLGVPTISTGDMLRGAVAAGSDLGLRVSGIMASGALVDDDTMADVVRDRLARADALRGFILDGYPRTLPQAETLRGILEDQADALSAVVLIDVDDEKLVDRALLRGRADDKAEVIRERLRVYREQTMPLIGYYRRLGLLREIDGNSTVDAVTTALLQAISS